MATFPTSLDTLTNPSGADNLDSPDHPSQHSTANDILEAVEAKVGIDSSAVTTSHDYKLSGVTGSDKAASVAGTETLTNKTLTTPTITAGVVATSFDMNGQKLILDANANTSITADVDDQIDIEISGADDFKFTANLFEALDGSDILVSNDDSYQVGDSGNTARSAVKARTDDVLEVGDSNLKGVMFQNGCFLNEPSVQTISNNSATALAWDTSAELWDPLDMHDPSSSNTRITVPVDGVYEVNASGLWADDVTDTVRILTIKVDGAAVADVKAAVDSQGRCGQTIYWVGNVSADSYVEFFVHHVAGGNLAFSQRSFSVKLVGELSVGI